jgi:polar amino acid transport system substrate-binding protein
MRFSYGMENKNLAYTALALACVSLVLGLSVFSQNSETQNTSDVVLEKVLTSGTLRAGYIVYPPYISKDPETGELSGVFYDITNAIGKQLDVKVEWVEEAGYGTIATNLSDGRYDVYAGIWPNVPRSKVITFTTPAYYDAVYAYARSADHRFDNNLNAINSSTIKISTIDGELGDSIAKETFAKAQRISLPQTSPFDQLSLQVITGKADITFLPPTPANLFLKSNPGTIRRVSETPVRVYGATLGVRLGETALRDALSIAINELVNVGTINTILDQYDETALRLAAPYAR